MDTLHQLSSLVKLLPGYIILKNTKGEILSHGRDIKKFISGLNDIPFGKTLSDRLVIEGGKELRIEEKIIFNEKEKFFLTKKSPVLDEKNNVIALMCTAFDITSYKKEEKKLLAKSSELNKRLKEALTYLDNVFANVPITLYWMDKEGRIVACNLWQAQVFGLESTQDLMGKNIFDVGEMLGWKKGLAEEINKNDRKIMQTAQPMRVEETFFLDNENRVLLSYKYPSFNDRQEVVGVFGFAIDITDRKKAEEELRIAKDKAEQANKAKTEFLNAAVKEIEEALNFKQKTKSEETKIYHEKIRQVLNDIKSFAKFDLVETNVFSTEDVGDSVKPLKVSGKTLELFYEFYKKFMLTKREAECLYYLIRGLTVKHIARTINLSYRTVEFYLNNAKLKLNCRTKQALISKVFESGVV